MKPRAHTVEEMRELFLDQLDALREYWLNERRAPSSKEKLEGFMHSVLVMLDGGSLAVPAFDVVPSPHPDDEHYHRAQNKNWWTPEVINDCQLHDEWNARRRNK